MEDKKKIDELEALEIETKLPSSVNTSVRDLEPTLNSQMKFPLPPVQVSPDALRQFYRGGQLPQKRLLNSPQVPITSGNSSTTEAVSGNSSGSSVVTVGLSIKQASVTSPVENFTSPIVLGKAFQCLYITANGACRIELYGSESSLALDAFRPIDSPPLAGTTQGLIFDLVLDTFPYVWGFSNVIGNNLDNPTVNLGYVSITNLGSTYPLTITMSYIPLVN